MAEVKYTQFFNNDVIFQDNATQCTYNFKIESNMIEDIEEKVLSCFDNAFRAENIRYVRDDSLVSNLRQGIVDTFKPLKEPTMQRAYLEKSGHIELDNYSDWEFTIAIELT